MARQLKRKHDSSDEDEESRPVAKQSRQSSNAMNSKPEVGEPEAWKEQDTDENHDSTPQAPPYTAIMKKLDEEIFDELDSREVGQEGAKIILPNEVHDVWTSGYYRKFYATQWWYRPAWDKNNFMKRLFLVMSILIRINTSDNVWSQFRSIFVDRKNRQDEDLPFTLETLQREDFLGKIAGKLFYTEQFTFCPSKIPQQEDEFVLDPRRRLPWIDNPVKIGEGAFGVVTKRTVAKGFLHYQDVTVNHTARAVAIKTLSGVDPGKDEFKNELKNLKDLRDCLSDHKRIMVNLVTMVEKTSQGNVYHIVYELAAYNLDVFLTNMPGKLRAKRHVFVSRERTDSENMWPGDLISESVNLADALDYLHNRLYTKSHTSLKTHVSLSHNDIKPDNILVVYPDTTSNQDKFPVGHWKLADFGLSVVKENRSCGSDNKLLSAENKKLSTSLPQKTHRTQKSGSVSKALPARDPGQYTAPEMDQVTPQLADCRRADLWSFGCVLSEIVTYAVKLECQLVENFRDSVGIRFYDHDSKDVKEKFICHLDRLPGTACRYERTSDNAPWIRKCADLIKKIVVKEPRKRLEANKIRDKLSEIDISMRDEKKEWLSHGGLVLDTNISSADLAASGQASAMSQSPTEYDDSDFARERSHGRLPSISVHPPEHTFTEPLHAQHDGEEFHRRATAPQ